MEIKTLGRGPAGIYANCLIVRQQPCAQVTVFKLNVAKATFGLVVTSNKALKCLDAPSFETLPQRTEGFELCSDIETIFQCEAIGVDGVGLTEIARLRPLIILLRRGASAGVRFIEEQTVEDLQKRAHADLVIGADELDSRLLFTVISLWCKFPKVSNRWYSANKLLLVADALRIVSYMVGAITRSASEDAHEVSAVIVDPDPDALATFDMWRRPAIDKITEAAGRNADWCDHFYDHMKLKPLLFAMNYVGRSRRLYPDRLNVMSPRFVAGCEAWCRHSVEATR